MLVHLLHGGCKRRRPAAPFGGVLEISTRRDEASLASLKASFGFAHFILVPSFVFSNISTGASDSALPSPQCLFEAAAAAACLHFSVSVADGGLFLLFLLFYLFLFQVKTHCWSFINFSSVQWLKRSICFF